MTTTINIDDNNSTQFHTILELEDITNASDHFLTLTEDLESDLNQTHENSDIEEKVSEAINTGKVKKEILRRMEEEYGITILDVTEEELNTNIEYKSQLQELIF